MAVRIVDSTMHSTFYLQNMDEEGTRRDIIITGSAGPGLQILLPQKDPGELASTTTLEQRLVQTKPNLAVRHVERKEPATIQSTHILQKTQDEVVSKPHNIPQVGMKILQPNETTTYYAKVKDAPQTPNFCQSSVSPDKSPKNPSTPENKTGGILQDLTFSPFDTEKHHKRLANMKKSLANQNFHPVKRAFAEMEGNCDETGNENKQIPLYGQATASNTSPLDGSGDHTQTWQGQDSSENTEAMDRDLESSNAFQFFGAFGSSNEADGPKSVGSMFQQSKSPDFSLFGSSSNDNTPGGFTFGFGSNNSDSQGGLSNTPGDGNFLSIFGDGGTDDQNNSNDGFTFNFGNNQSKSSGFSFF